MSKYRKWDPKKDKIEHLSKDDSIKFKTRPGSSWRKLARGIDFYLKSEVEGVVIRVIKTGSYWGTRAFYDLEVSVPIFENNNAYIDCTCYVQSKDIVAVKPFVGFICRKK